MRMKGVVRNPAIVLLLGIVTCGIYLWYWIYAIGTELKAYLDDESINPGLDTLLSVLCGVYMLYVFYNYSKKIYQAQVEENVPYAQDNAVLYLIIGLFVPIVTILLMQNELNKVWNS